jgi:hypothetical protein
VQASPISEIFNTGVDYLFYGYVGDVVAQNVTNGSISTTTIAAEPGGTSGIVVDNISGSAQASSIYFTTLSKEAFTAASTVPIASVTTPGGFSTTYTATTTTPHGFANGDAVTISGVTCGGAATCSCNFILSGTFTPNVTGATITVGTSTTFTYSSTDCIASAKSDTDTGTATDPTAKIQAYGAIKLTQNGLK